MIIYFQHCQLQHHTFHTTNGNTQTQNIKISALKSHSINKVQVQRVDWYLPVLNSKSCTCWNNPTGSTTYQKSGEELLIFNSILLYTQISTQISWLKDNHEESVYSWTEGTGSSWDGQTPWIHMCWVHDTQHTHIVPCLEMFSKTFLLQNFKFTLLDQQSCLKWQSWMAESSHDLLIIQWAVRYLHRHKTADPVVILTNWNGCYRQSLWVSNLPEVQTTTDGGSSYSTHNTVMLKIQVHVSWTSTYVLSWILGKANELSKSVQFMQE